MSSRNQNSSDFPLQMLIFIIHYFWLRLLVIKILLFTIARGHTNISRGYSARRSIQISQNCHANTTHLFPYSLSLSLFLPSALNVFIRHLPASFWKWTALANWSELFKVDKWRYAESNEATTQLTWKQTQNNLPWRSVEAYWCLTRFDELEQNALRDFNINRSRIADQRKH